MPPRRPLKDVPTISLSALQQRFDDDLCWVYSSCDPETQKMLYDALDEIVRNAMHHTIQGTAPGSFRRTYDKIKKVMGEP